MWVYAFISSFNESRRANDRLINTKYNKIKMRKKNAKQNKTEQAGIKHMQKYKREYKYSSLDRLFGSIKIHAHWQINNNKQQNHMYKYERENGEHFLLQKTWW